MDLPHIRICLAAFILDAALMVMLTAMPFYLYDHLDGTVKHPGIFGATQSILYAFICISIAGWMNRNHHSMKIAAFGAFYYCAGSAAAVLSPGLIGFGVISILAIMGMSIVWPSLHGWLGANPDPQLRARGMGRFNVAWSSGLAIGPLIGGFLYDFHPYAPFIALVCMGCACFALLWGMPQEEQYYATLADAPAPDWASHAERSERFLMSAWIANGMAWALVGVTRLIFTKRVDELVERGELRLLTETAPPAYLMDNAASIYATIAFLLAAMSAVIFGLMGKTRHWQHRFRYIAGLQLGSAVAFWILGYTNSLIVMSLAFMVIGALSGAAFFSSSYYGMANYARRRQRASINEVFVGVGSFLGPMAVGLLAEKVGVQAPFIYMPIVVVAGLGVQLYLIRGRHQRAAAESV